MKIGVFDSGLGGLTIFRAFLEHLPEYNYVYLGDNARVPYGNRSEEIIYRFTKEAIEFLFKKNCQLVIIACNTSTAAALKKIQREYLPKHHGDRKVLGIIKPTIEHIGQSHTSSPINRVGVIGTKTTVDSGAFIREIKKTLPKALVFQEACPLLVPFIEEGITKNHLALEFILKEYLAGLIERKIDTLILGCTHYELLKNPIQKIVGKKVKVVTEGKPAAEKLKEYLSHHKELEKKLEKKRKVSYFVTDLNPNYHRLMKLFLKPHSSNIKVELAQIDNV